MNQPERNLGRATWQRTEGRFLFNVATALYFDDFQNRVTDEDIKFIKADPGIPGDPGYGTFWRRYFSVADQLSEAYDAPEAYKFREKLTTQAPGRDTGIIAALSKYTFHQRLPRVMAEGIETSTHFPLNLARAMNLAHEHLYGAALFDDAAGLVQVIEDPSFSAYLKDASLVPNGFWRAFSTRPWYYNNYNNPSDCSAPFAPDDQNAFGLKLNLSVARQELSALNKTGDVGDAFATELSSSGCPVRSTNVGLPATAEAAADRALVAELAGEKIVSVAAQSSGIEIAHRNLVGLLKRAVDLGL